MSEQKWTTTPPVVPGHYWAYDPAGWLDIVVVDTQRFDWPHTGLKEGDMIVKDDDEYLPVEGYATYWLGPLVVPELPVVGDDAT